jgi:hypothetical protein
MSSFSQGIKNQNLSNWVESHPNGYNLVQWIVELYTSRTFVKHLLFNKRGM